MASARGAATLGLSDLEDVPAALLSAGQKRRLGLARLLCAERPLWLLDEPAVSLDTASQQVLSAMVAAHLERGGIVAAATHTPLGWTDAGSSRSRIDRRRAAGRSGMRQALALIRRDLLLARRQGGALVTALGFYLVIVSALPLGLGPDLNLLSRIAPGVLWVALLLAALLSAAACSTTITRTARWR